MRESIGGAQVLIIVITILVVMLILLTASISYTKAFKARNAIINIVEKYAERDMEPSALLAKTVSVNSNKTVEDEIDEYFNEMGYMKTLGTNWQCPERDGATSVAPGHNHRFCIYYYAETSYDKNGKIIPAEHYGILTYMYFEIPFLGRNDRFIFPIYGDTISLRGVDSNAFKPVD